MTLATCVFTRSFLTEPVKECFGWDCKGTQGGWKLAGAGGKVDSLKDHATL